MPRLFGYLFLLLSAQLNVSITEAKCASLQNTSDKKDLIQGSIVYFHAPNASKSTLEKAADRGVIFEIDLAFAHNAFNSHVIKDSPYIGHPEEFYTEMEREFPAENSSFSAFEAFVQKHPSMKVLIDLKDIKALPYLQKFIKAVGAKRCIVHAFIRNWVDLTPEEYLQPHWDKELIDLFEIDAILSPLGVPLIANCKGFNDDYVDEKSLVDRMICDANICKSVVSLGIYYSGAPLPRLCFLEKINSAGYIAWINGNIEGFAETLGYIRYIAMCDRLAGCSYFAADAQILQ